MIDYNLAKELKEAGFPQKRNLISQLSNGGTETSTFDCYSPTLSELINACVKLLPEGDFHLEHIKRGKEPWQASGCRRYATKQECEEYGWKEGKELIWDDWFSGKAPLEDVAKLFIALNKKNK